MTSSLRSATVASEQISLLTLLPGPPRADRAPTATELDDSGTPMLSVLSMAQLIVRDIDKALVDLLKRRAAAHGRSAEAEHREILRAALQPRPATSLRDHLLAMPAVGDDADFAIERSAARRVKL